MIPVYIGYCAVFKVREEARARDLQASAKSTVARRRRAGLSKLNSMRHVVDWELAPKQRAFPGPVDISSPNALLAPVNSRFNQSARLARLYCLTGSGCPNKGTSLERR
jgi:hypothetical protein